MRTERISITSVDFAQKLHITLAPHLPEFPYPVSVKKPASATARAVHSCNSNIRLYKYAAGQYFGPHYDDSVRDAETGAKSEWTLLIYLTGAQDGVEGGEVRVPIHPYTSMPHRFTDHLLSRATRTAPRNDRATAKSRAGVAAPVGYLQSKPGRPL